MARGCAGARASRPARTTSRSAGSRSRSSRERKPASSSLCLRNERFRQSIDETRHRHHFAEENEAAAGVCVMREALERGGQRRIVREARRPFEQPAIEPRFDRAEIGLELGVKSRRIVDEITRMYLEEPREQLP